MSIPIPLIARIVAAVATAGAGVAAAVWGKDLWAWLTGAPPPKDALEKARVLVAGPTGVGKTTLIRAALGTSVGKVGEGLSQTPGIEWLGTSDFPIWFADSEGLTVVMGTAQVKDIQAKLGAWNIEERPHCAWLCIQADAARVIGSDDETEDQKRDRGTEGELGRLLNDAKIPVIVVISQADTGGQPVEDMVSRCNQVFPFAQNVVPICAEPRTGGGVTLIPAHGLDSLKRATVAVLPSPIDSKVESGWSA